MSTNHQECFRSQERFTVTVSSRFAFTSRRERCLWLWTLGVVAAIYSTIGLARTLAAALGETGLGAGLYILACVMVLTTVITQGLKKRPSRAEIVVALGVTTAYLLVFVRMAVPTERSHLIEYGVVAVFIYEALLERAKQGRRVRGPARLAVLVTALLGLLDECIQLFVPGRVFDPRDVLFNVLAAVMATTASAVLRWARGRRWRRHHER